MTEQEPLEVKSLLADPRVAVLKTWFIPQVIREIRLNFPAICEPSVFVKGFDSAVTKSNDISQRREEIRAIVVLAKGRVKTKKPGSELKPEVNYQYSLVQTNDGNLIVSSKREGQSKYFFYYDYLGATTLEQTKVEANNLKELTDDARSQGHKQAENYLEAIKKLFGGNEEEALRNLGELFKETPQKYFHLMRLMIIANGGYLPFAPGGRDFVFFLKQERTTRKGLGGLSIVAGSFGMGDEDKYTIWKIPDRAEITDDVNIVFLRGIDVQRLKRHDINYVDDLEANGFNGVVLEKEVIGSLK
ncbi:MAG: hypothetical protein M1514_02425 [Patescibacteria group bacterium]|nr:hypothetical protein [Patescibacteria group bacterium]